jgi:hypothetical protein
MRRPSISRGHTACRAGRLCFSGRDSLILSRGCAAVATDSSDDLSRPRWPQRGKAYRTDPHRLPCGYAAITAIRATAPKPEGDPSIILVFLRPLLVRVGQATIRIQYSLRFNCALLVGPTLTASQYLKTIPPLPMTNPRSANIETANKSADVVDDCSIHSWPPSEVLKITPL